MCIEIIEFCVRKDIQVVEANILLRLVCLHRVQLFSHELGQVGPLAPVVGHFDVVVQGYFLFAIVVVDRLNVYSGQVGNTMKVGCCVVSGVIVLYR